MCVLLHLDKPPELPSISWPERKLNSMFLKIILKIIKEEACLGIFNVKIQNFILGVCIFSFFLSVLRISC